MPKKAKIPDTDECFQVTIVETDEIYDDSQLIDFWVQEFVKSTEPVV